MLLHHAAVARPTKSRTSFLCQDCGHTSPKWEGRCTSCGTWGTYVEFTEGKQAPAARRAHVSPAVGFAGPAVALPIGEQPGGGERRLNVGMPEVERLLGGGIVSGSMLLLAGDPGSGKSTLLLQVAAHVAASGSPVLYVSGEESGSQVRLRARRLGVEDSGVLFAAETDAEAVVGLLGRSMPALAIVDSIQTLASGDTPSAAGSVAQVRDCAQILLGWAKANDVPLFLTGHVTKDGNVAGPRVLEHMVDVVLSLEGEASSGMRVLRCTKNRFGSTNDVALLEMQGDGIAEVADPSAALLGERRDAVPGSAVAVVLEGTRSLLCEVQALTSPSAFNPPRRTATGFDFNRMVMLSAVLARRAHVRLADQDVMVNVPGGLRLAEPAADLGVVLALVSSVRDVPVAPSTVCIGEVGLNGEVRRVPQLDRRLAEAHRHGFSRALVPAASAKSVDAPPGMVVTGVDDVREAVAQGLAGSVPVA